MDFQGQRAVGYPGVLSTAGPGKRLFSGLKFMLMPIHTYACECVHQPGSSLNPTHTFEIFMEALCRHDPLSAQFPAFFPFQEDVDWKS